MNQSERKYQFLPWFAVSLKTMMSRFDQGNFPQSLLITGERDIGKKYFARDLAKSILCLDRTGEKSCGRCQACIWFEKNNHPDFLFVTALDKSNFIKIDQIRQITQFVQITSETGKKVIIIENADEMNSNAANALLKTLEEPANQCYLILVSHFPKKLPITIVSRCQRENLSLRQQEAMIVPWLKGQNPMASMDDIKRVLTVSYGRPILSQKLVGTDQLGLIKELEILFVRYLSNKNNLEELSLFIVKNWQLSSHMLLFWLVSALKESVFESAVSEALNVVGTSEILRLYEKFIEVVQLESTTVRQDWMISDWLLSFNA